MKRKNFFQRAGNAIARFVGKTISLVAVADKDKDGKIETEEILSIVTGIGPDAFSILSNFKDNFQDFKEAAGDPVRRAEVINDFATALELPNTDFENVLEDVLRTGNDFGTNVAALIRLAGKRAA